jgi:nucleoside-diphosphate-sugar epimerase
MDLENNTITFVTGGTSSIGRVLIKELSRKGETLKVLVRKSSNREGLELPGVTFVFGDVTDFKAVVAGMQGCTRVTHMAAVVGSDLPEAEWWRVNRDGARNVLQAAHDLGISSMVQVSSLSVLGDTQPGEIADETRPIDPTRHINLYQKTKFAADEIAREFAGRGLPVKIVYPGFGFGCSFASSHPSMQDQTLLRMAAGKPVVIMGSGKNKLFVAYYRDTVAGICMAHRSGKSGDGYILGNENRTFPEIWEAIAGILGKKAPQARIPVPLLKAVSFLGAKLRGKPIFPQDFFDMIALNWCFSNRKAQEALGWQPHAFKDAMTETWSDYQRQGWILHK